MEQEPVRMAEAMIKITGLKDALYRMHNEGKLDLGEVNEYFREAVGGLSVMRLTAIGVSNRIPLSDVLMVIEGFQAPNYEVLKLGSDLGGHNNG